MSKNVIEVEKKKKPLWKKILWFIILLFISIGVLIGVGAFYLLLYLAYNGGVVFHDLQHLFTHILPAERGW